MIFQPVGYTIMGKTADLIDVQRAVIDALHKRDKIQNVIPELASC